jgi:endonuclease III
MSSALKQKALAKLAGVIKKTDDPPPLDIVHRMVYAVCREGVTREEADAAFKKLGEAFFDLNEIRVSAAREVARAIQQLPDSMDRGERIIAILQEVFETTYSYDLETLHKKGLKQAQKVLERYRGSSPFLVAYVLRHSMDGHAIPIDEDILRCLKRLQIVEDLADIESAQATMESHIPKTKGTAVSEALTLISQDFCFEGVPKCPPCPMHEVCPSAVLKKSSSGSSTKLAAAKKK